MKADLAHFAAQLPQPPNARYKHGAPFITAMEHGSMRVELFAPASAQLGRDIQQPHEQDEIYVVQGGSSDFWLSGQRFHVVAGDVLFVPAGQEHHFEGFSDDFLTWVIFYGPRGGENA